MSEQQKPPLRPRFDEAAFSLSESFSIQLFESVPEVKSVAVIIDFGIDAPNIPAGSWHTPNKQVAVGDLIGMLKRVPVLYDQLVNVMRRFNQMQEEKVNEQRGTDSGSDQSGV